MVKANSKVTDLNGVIKVYGSERKLRRAFGLSANDWATWQAHGVPRGHHLGLYMGLKARGLSRRAGAGERKELSRGRVTFERVMALTSGRRRTLVATLAGSLAGSLAALARTSDA